MTARKVESRSKSVRRNHGEELKDEVYRQMFRLEACRPGAEVKLAIALLRAWLESSTGAKMRGSRQWLNKISPICIVMIEAAQQASCACNQRTQ